MEIIKICIIGVVTAFCVLVLKDVRSDVATLLSIVGGLLIMLIVVDMLTGIVTIFTAIANEAGLGGEFLSIIIKIVGLGFVIDFCAGICEDTGNKNLSEKVILGGKIAIMFVSLPIVSSLFHLIVDLL
ncbi:MAG: stage III sporulation AC/AD family protein [Firmicutes bacterium]|nr:stage III sporulation AC/AD family protein [Bacillota bacterium]MCL1944929.1 stage III sporulation AC/AD family protein [Bacillota bacterium]MCL1954259.1 stage III sporulation AC/AD family protein [Bacillota bacterium]